MHDPICARLEIDLAKAESDNARLKGRVTELEEKLTERETQLGRRQRDVTAYAERNDFLRRANDALCAQVASVAERQREACAKACDEGDFYGDTYAKAMRETPLVTDTPPEYRQVKATPDEASDRAEMLAEAKGACFDEPQPDGFGGTDEGSHYMSQTKASDLRPPSMSRNEIQEALDQTAQRAAPALIHDLSVSCASFIAAIDSDSNRVATYLEKRLSPLIPLMRTDERVRSAVKRIVGDGRAPKRIVDPPTQEDPYVSPKGKVVGALVSKGRLEAAEKHIAELECIHRVDEEVNIRLDAESVRLRAKCSRQRRELRAKNMQVRAMRGDCMRLKYELDSALHVIDEKRGELSALRAENEKYRLGMQENVALRQEIEKLRAREAPESAAERYYDIGWWHGTTATVVSHPLLKSVPSRGELRDFHYQPPQEAPAETSRCTCYDDGVMCVHEPTCPVHGANRKAERCTCRPAPWFGYADDCPKHGRKGEPAGAGEKR